MQSKGSIIIIQDLLYLLKFLILILANGNAMDFCRVNKEWQFWPVGQWGVLC